MPAVVLPLPMWWHRPLIEGERNGHAPYCLDTGDRALGRL